MIKKKLDPDEYSELRRKAMHEIEAEQRHRDKIEKKGLFKWL